MRMLTKILPLFLSAAPMTVLAMEGEDNIIKTNKRPHSSISVTEAEGLQDPKGNKRQKAQEIEKIIAALDQEKKEATYIKKLMALKKL